MDTTHTETNDPRPRFFRALDQAEYLVSAVQPGELTSPTPCAEYDVHALCGHMVAVLRKLSCLGAGQSAAQVPDVVNVADDWSGAFRRARTEVDHVWEHDAVLDHHGRHSRQRHEAPSAPRPLA